MQDLRLNLLSSKIQRKMVSGINFIHSESECNKLLLKQKQIQSMNVFFFKTIIFFFKGNNKVQIKIMLDLILCVELGKAKLHTFSYFCVQIFIFNFMCNKIYFSCRNLTNSNVYNKTYNRVLD